MRRDFRAPRVSRHAADDARLVAPRVVRGDVEIQNPRDDVDDDDDDDDDDARGTTR